MSAIIHIFSQSVRLVQTFILPLFCKDNNSALTLLHSPFRNALEEDLRHSTTESR